MEHEWNIIVSVGVSIDKWVIIRKNVCGRYKESNQLTVAGQYE